MAHSAALWCVFDIFPIFSHDHILKGEKGPLFILFRDDSERFNNQIEISPGGSKWCILGVFMIFFPIFPYDVFPYSLRREYSTIHTIQRRW